LRESKCTKLRVTAQLILSDMLKICELFKSIQGESTYAGRICSFVRLSGCNLACSYCDTQYAFAESQYYSIEQIVEIVNSQNSTLVEITGGEPLIQKETPALCQKFLDNNYTVLVETNGSLPIDLLPEGCIRIIDVKCPGSGEAGSFLIENIGKLVKSDELKFVLSDRNDFLWALEFVKKHKLDQLTTVLFSPCMGKVTLSELAAWILENNAPVRLGLQLHKLIWGEKRGV
jgi:7-carboxy-7-deazaguanine synthase